MPWCLLIVNFVCCCRFCLGKPVDMWSFGVLLFLLLSGDAPFKDPNVKVGLFHSLSGYYYYFFNVAIFLFTLLFSFLLIIIIIFLLFFIYFFISQSLYNKIKNGVYYFKSTAWHDISPVAADLVKQLLVVPQLERLTVQQALDHEWFKLDSGIFFYLFIYLFIFKFILYVLVLYK